MEFSLDSLARFLDPEFWKGKANEAKEFLDPASPYGTLSDALKRGGEQARYLSDLQWQRQMSGLAQALGYQQDYMGAVNDYYGRKGEGVPPPAGLTGLLAVSPPAAPPGPPPGQPPPSPAAGAAAGPHGSPAATPPPRTDRSQFGTGWRGVPAQRDDLGNAAHNITDARFLLDPGGYVFTDWLTGKVQR